MRTMLLASSILLGGPLLAGCSSALLDPMESKSPIYTGVSKSAEASQQALQDARVCCTRLDEIRVKPLVTDKTEYYRFDTNSPAFQFATGKSFFQAFEIPDHLYRATLTVTAIADATVFVPTVLILDENFRASRAIGSDQFHYVPAGFLEPQRLLGKFTIDRRDGGDLSREKYVLVFTTDADLQGSTPMISEAKLYARVRGVVDPGLPDPVAKHAATGVIRISVSDLETSDKTTRRYVSEQDSARRYVEPVATTPRGTETAPVPTPSPLAPSKPAPGQGQPPMLSETQALYDRMIREAVANGDMDRAWRLVGEAERAGSSSARRTFVEAVEQKK